MLNADDHAGKEYVAGVYEGLGDKAAAMIVANLMKQTSHLNLELGMLRPGITVTRSPTDYQPIKGLFLIRFDGKEWVQVGSVLGERNPEGKREDRFFAALPSCVRAGRMTGSKAMPTAMNYSVSSREGPGLLTL